MDRQLDITGGGDDLAFATSVGFGHFDIPGVGFGKKNLFGQQGTGDIGGVQGYIHTFKAKIRHQYKLPRGFLSGTFCLGYYFP